MLKGMPSTFTVLSLRLIFQMIAVHSIDLNPFDRQRLDRISQLIAVTLRVGLTTGTYDFSAGIAEKIFLIRFCAC